MKARTLLLGLAISLVGAAVCFAQDPNIGTWRLNEAKSHMPPELAKNRTVVYEAAGDNVKVTIDGTDKDGKPIHSEWTGKFDGKNYPVTGNPALDSRSYQKTRRSYDGDNQHEGRQSCDQCSYCHSGRRQDAHCASDPNRLDG